MRILIVFGTRPEAIKMAPVVQALRDECGVFEVRVCVTAQHRQMLDSVLEAFCIQPEFDLDLMRPGQDLGDLTSRALLGVRQVIREWRPDRVLVHGDTTTTFAASLAAFYERVPVGHVEAGLRTGDLLSPWPEEFNRRAACVLSDLHFAPTSGAQANLLAEGVRADRIFVTGNTGIDALLGILKRIREDASLRIELDERLSFLDPSRKLILVTGHRRENFGGGMEAICWALRDLVERFPDIEVVYPVHLNPNVRSAVDRILRAEDVVGRDRIHLIEPLDYVPFVHAMSRAHLILTDSGGIQEEAPSLGKPILVMRDTTERPEGVAAGCAILVGADREKILGGTVRLLTDSALYASMAESGNPYGAGDAAHRITAALRSLRQADQVGFRTENVLPFPDKGVQIHELIPQVSNTLQEPAELGVGLPLQ